MLMFEDFKSVLRASYTTVFVERVPPKMQQSYPIQGQPAVATVALTTPQRSNIRQSYNTSTSKCLGATQIAIGISCFILQVVAIVIQAGAHFLGHGIWCGLFVSGICHFKKLKISVSIE